MTRRSTAAAVPAVRPSLENVTTEWLDLTPDVAFKWLEKNTHNRPLIQSRVERYARDMRAGQWQVNGDAIRFDVNDVLIDGQHRLWAVTYSQATLRTLVVRGLPPEAQDTIDQGKVRTVREVLHLRGVADAKIRAPALMMIFSLATNKGGLYTPSVAQRMHEFWQADVDWLVSQTTKYTKRAQVAAALTIAHRKHPEQIDEFTRKLNSGENLAAGMPALILREYIIGMIGQKGRADRGRDPAGIIVRKTLRAAAAHILRERLSKLQMSEAGWQYFVPDRRLLVPPDVMQSLWRDEPVPEQSDEE